MREDEYRTVNADLAAALITVGARLRALDTSDGVTIEFVFDPTILNHTDEDDLRPALPVTHVVEDWSRNNLSVDASTLTKNIKRVYKQVRDRKREWANTRGN